jgi:hypothetical protein
MVLNALPFVAIMAAVWGLVEGIKALVTWIGSFGHDAEKAVE